MRSLPFDNFSVVQDFDEVIDVRSPSEFKEDHIPGAINLPVLDDTERAIVGTLHSEAGEFEARKIGAAMISASIACHLNTHFARFPKSYRALIYCWRGGQRSKSMATILSAIGWQATLVAGGYKGYRAFVRAELKAVCSTFQPIILNGLTGSGKTLILRRMAELGELQILDLEALANHRGSLLGDEVKVNDAKQPLQKGFESRLLAALNQLDHSRPVFVESESKRIGTLACPESLWKQMVAAPVVHINVSIEERAQHLIDAYEHFIQEPQQLIDKLPVLKKIHGTEQINRWITLTKDGNWKTLAESLLEVHYDPSYRRCNNYAEPNLKVDVPSLSKASDVDNAIAQLVNFSKSLNHAQVIPNP